MEKSVGLYEFMSIGELAETTTQLLALDLQYGSGKSSAGSQTSDRQVKHFVLQKARDYLAEAREGFVLSVRTGQVTGRAELRFLIEQVLTNWREFSAELGLADGSTAPENDGAIPEPQRIRSQLLAFGMAAVALGQLPRLPADQVTFPYSYGQPPTYADIDAPSSPGAMLQRIEEAAQMLWQLMDADAQELVKHRYGPLRRTYGFFEASAHLAVNEASRFGVKPNRGNLTLLS